VGKVVMYSSVSVDGFVADENDQPGPLFDWLSSGDVPLDESGALKVSQTSYDYTRPYWDQIGATIVGRHVFDMTDGWDGKPPGGMDHMVVVTHRPEPEGWDPEAPFHFVDGVEAAVAKAQQLAGDRLVEVAAWRRRWPGACRGPGRRGAHGRRTRRVRVRQALLRVGPRAAPVGGS
jgi:dihydrofolate reductase